MRVKVIWVGRAYGSYCVKSLREDRVLGYDVLALGDVSVI